MALNQTDLSQSNLEPSFKSNLGPSFLENMMAVNKLLDTVPTKGRILLYRLQAKHDPLCLREAAATNIPVFITGKVRREWSYSIKAAIHNIRIAVPGLRLTVVRDHSRARIIVYPLNGEVDHKTAHTDDKIFAAGGIARIYIGEGYAKHIVETYDQSWFKPVTDLFRTNPEEQIRVTTCTHELLHALGLVHEHQTKCNAKYLDSTGAGFRPEQVQVNLDYFNLTRYDPHSIMLYPKLTYRKPEEDPAATATPDEKTSFNLDMSELDKVALNMLYPPRIHSGFYGEQQYEYQPTERECAGTRMYYCFRNVMDSHNYPYYKINNGICGNDKNRPSGPNCPACRTLKCAQRSFLDDRVHHRWQGWSGMIYCGDPGKYHPCNHPCGPDTGYPCSLCRALVDPK